MLSLDSNRRGDDEQPSREVDAHFGELRGSFLGGFPTPTTTAATTPGAPRTP